MESLVVGGADEVESEVADGGHATGVVVALASRNGA